MNYISEVEIISFLKKYAHSQKQICLSIPHSYAIDSGLYVFVDRRDDYGKLIEGTVFSHLVRIYKPNFELFYYRTKDGYEVDFVIKESLKVKQLIQVTYASSRDEINRREIRALLKASKELKCRDLLVITWDYEDEDNNVKLIPLWKWLLVYE